MGYLLAIGVSLLSVPVFLLGVLCIYFGVYGTSDEPPSIAGMFQGVAMLAIATWLPFYVWRLLYLEHHGNRKRD